MLELNEVLFLLLNAPEQPNAILLTVAKILAEPVIWVIPLSLLGGWLLGSGGTRKLMLQATVSGLAGLLIAQAIGLLWQHPRPFAMGLGHQFIAHAADSSFPSDHLTLLWGVAFSFLMHQRARLAGTVLALLGVLVAWARIYLGVHFPLDMLGAALVAGLSSYLCLQEERRIVEALLPWVTAIHQRLFAPLIRRGWVRQ